MSNNKNNNYDDSQFISSLIVAMFGIIFFLFGVIAFLTNSKFNKDFSLISQYLFSLGLIIFGVGFLILFISDSFFVGPKFDSIYMDKVKDAKDKEAKFKLPYARFLPGFKPFRTIVYSWGIISQKFRDKEILGDDDLIAMASKIDIIMAWGTIGTLLCGLVLLLLGAVFKNV